jgi:hypothetical protein
MSDMETNAAQKPKNWFRSDVSWTKAVAWSALVTSILFALANWHGCWLFRQEFRDLVVFLYLFGWLVLFLAARTKWRILLLVVTIPAVILHFGLNGIPEMNASAESGAVEALRQMQSNLHAYRDEHHQQGYADALPPVKLSYPRALKYYRFDYVPSRSADGRILNYLIQATPTRRDCDFYRSFTIRDDGRVFWTVEPRAATPSDEFLPE